MAQYVGHRGAQHVEQDAGAFRSSRRGEALLERGGVLGRPAALLRRPPRGQADQTTQQRRHRVGSDLRGVGAQPGRHEGRPAGRAGEVEQGDALFLRQWYES